MSVDARPAPRLRTLAEVDAAIERDEALLTQYRFELAELEADGEVTVALPANWCASSSGGSPCSACGGSRASSPG